MLIFLKYTLFNFWSPYHYTIRIDVLSIRISIMIISIMISKQSKHWDQQGMRNYAFWCMSCDTCIINRCRDILMFQLFLVILNMKKVLYIQNTPAYMSLVYSKYIHSFSRSSAFALCKTLY